MGKREEKAERIEVLWRIVLGIISGFILQIWGYVVWAVIIIHLIYALITGKRSKQMAEFVEYWTSTFYTFIGYVSGRTNKRPFPFGELISIGKFDGK